MGVVVEEEAETVEATVEATVAEAMVVVMVVVVVAAEMEEEEAEVVTEVEDLAVTMAEVSQREWLLNLLWLIQKVLRTSAPRTPVGICAKVPYSVL